MLFLQNAEQVPSGQHVAPIKCSRMFEVVDRLIRKAVLGQGTADVIEYFLDAFSMKRSPLVTSV